MHDDHADASWDAFTRGVVARWAAGGAQEALHQLGELASACAPPWLDAAPDAPPRWLDGDVDAGPFGGAANLAWLLTAYAVVGGEAGLRDERVELALQGAAQAASRCGASLRDLASSFSRDGVHGREEALAGLFARRVLAALRAVDAPRVGVVLGDLLDFFPDVVGTRAWASLAQEAERVVKARVQARDEAVASALVEALAGAVEARGEAIARRGAGLRALRGARRVWVAEDGFGTARHAEALAALDDAEAVYAALPEVVDVPRGMVSLLRGKQAAREGRQGEATALLAASLVYFGETARAPAGVLVDAAYTLARVAAGDAGRLAQAEDAFARARAAAGQGESTSAIVLRKATLLGRARVALARAEAGDEAGARATLTALHAQLWDASLDDGTPVEAVALVGETHARLGEHAAARGCFATALVLHDAQRDPRPAEWFELTRSHLVSLARTRSLDDLATALQAGLARVVARGYAAREVGRRWDDVVCAAVAAEGSAVEAQGPAGAQLAVKLRRLAEAWTVAGLEAQRAAEERRRREADPRSLAAPWLEPLAGASPAGREAVHDARYERVVELVASLDAASTPDAMRARVWREVDVLGRDLLAEETRDLLLAAYVAHAMAWREGATGLVRGLALLEGLVTRYWETMFPPATRTKRRANALAWYLERTAAAVDQGGLEVGVAPRIAEALALLEALARATRDRLGDATPRFAPLKEALERRAFDRTSSP